MRVCPYAYYHLSGIRQSYRFDSRDYPYRYARSQDSPEALSPHQK